MAKRTKSSIEERGGGQHLDLPILELERLVARVTSHTDLASDANVAGASPRSHRRRLEMVAHNLLSHLSQQAEGYSAERTLAQRQGDASLIPARVRKWAGGDAEALDWYKCEPIAAFGDRTAESLVRTGQGEAPRDYLDSVALGGFA